MQAQSAAQGWHEGLLQEGAGQANSASPGQNVRRGGGRGAMWVGRKPLPLYTQPSSCTTSMEGAGPRPEQCAHLTLAGVYVAAHLARAVAVGQVGG